MYPRACAGNPHASYHLDGTFHQKTYGSASIPQKRQSLTAAFRENKHLGMYYGHGKSAGAVCDPQAFDGIVIVEPGVLGPKQGAVGVDLVAGIRGDVGPGDRPSILLRRCPSEAGLCANRPAVGGHYNSTIVIGARCRYLGIRR
jgi:hypothetical protein